MDRAPWSVPREVLEQVGADRDGWPAGLVDAMAALGVDSGSDAAGEGSAAAVVELLLEGLHLGRRLSKDADDGDTVFSA